MAVAEKERKNLEDIEAVEQIGETASSVADIADPVDDDAVFTLARLTKDTLQPSPINPDWILEGNPEAKVRNLSVMSRGWATTDHWSCTAGKFRWYYDWDETVMFLEGEVVITDDEGQVYVGRPGTSLFFPAGSSATWVVPRYIRKIAFNQRPVPAYLHILARGANKVFKVLGLPTRP
ncbi:DUF861 domain-containing protein [Roseibium polysiphoniae]|uniref:DUF861 domain-containing protein n=1 Tax=Roseibium polysiphoniae TaxID=2571221 RepID=A0A944GUR7_9HYPH|nr:cupin domain-containing protein [Roseibium polysiphoniae]MBS8261906.1 DUF861 domain-containing protein [Roseibium polysiphoniae]